MWGGHRHTARRRRPPPTIRSTRRPPWGTPGAAARVWMPHSVFATRTKRPARSDSVGSTGTDECTSPKDLKTYVTGAAGEPASSSGEA